MNIMSEISKLLKKKGVKKDVNKDTKFKDLGIDSLDLMDLIIEAEKQLDIHIPDDRLMEIQSVQDLINIINELKPSLNNKK